MKQPNFMCIGAPKCGTTTLYDILKQHPDVSLTSFKEPHFFDIDNNYKEGYNWYLQEYYTDLDDKKAIGEFTPSYFIVPKVSNRIFKNLGKNLKFILILRNPVDRAYSQYLHAKRDLFDELSFEDAIFEEKNRLINASLNNDDISYMRYSYINGGLYFSHLQRFLEDYEMSQFKIFIFEEEFRNDRDGVLMDISKFLDINDIKIDTNIKSNVAADVKYPIIKRILQGDSIVKSFMKSIIKSKQTRSKISNYLQKISNKKAIKSEINNELRINILNKYFLHDIKNLEKLINRDLSVWYRETL